MVGYYLKDKRKCITCNKLYLPTSPMQKYCCPEHSPHYKEPNIYFSKKNRIYKSINRWSMNHPKYTEKMVVDAINNYFKNQELEVPSLILKTHPYFKICNKHYSSKFKNYNHYIHLCQMIALKKIIIPDNYKCEICNINLAKVRHHPDYFKPLFVEFLCKSCHAKLHHSSRTSGY